VNQIAAGQGARCGLQARIVDRKGARDHRLLGHARATQARQCVGPGKRLQGAVAAQNVLEIFDLGEIELKAERRRRRIIHEEMFRAGLRRREHQRFGQARQRVQHAGCVRKLLGGDARGGKSFKQHEVGNRHRSHSDDASALVRGRWGPPWAALPGGDRGGDIKSPPRSASTGCAR
jgi:hypothetical protein